MVELLEEKSRTHPHWRTKEQLRLFSQSDSKQKKHAIDYYIVNL